ncbi:ImmA/IrrE family metallo-endopeptidase [Streptomyces sp. URMC 123]|uniref:ImmA/IrrE family metallo-endopeptidase n=1 Tax=Streptomyces sp. URMC 123 TaxID=3423403 RepID=UPI003F1C86D1
MTDLCEHLSRSRDRPIVLVPMPVRHASPCGLWVACETADIILYEPDTSPSHQEHIIAHELAHILCGHHGEGRMDDAGTRALFPDLDPQLVRDMLGRTAYTDPQEREAEMIASLILKRARRRPAEETAAVPLPPENADVIGRIENTIRRR